MTDDPLWPDANLTKRELMYNRFMKEDDGPPSTMNIEAYRENRNGRTFSTEVMEECFDTLAAMVAANMKYKWDTTGKAPHHIRIGISIEIES